MFHNKRRVKIHSNLKQSIANDFDEFTVDLTIVAMPQKVFVSLFNRSYYHDEHQRKQTRPRARRAVTDQLS